MKISTSLNHAMNIEGVSARESARMMREAGFDGVDLALCHDMLDFEKMMTDEWAEKPFQEAEALKAEGLEIAQCHLPYFPGHLPLPGDGTMNGFVDTVAEPWAHVIEIAGRIGCPIAVMHPGGIVEEEPEVIYEGNARLIELLLPTAKKWNVKLTVENCFNRAHGKYVDAHVSRAEDIMEILRRTDENWVGACIDTGHARIFRINPGDMARTYGSRLFALHVNSNAGEDSHCLPHTLSGWTEKMDFYAFSAALREIGYKGSYNLEVDTGKLPRGCAQPYLNLAAAIARGLSDLAE